MQSHVRLKEYELLNTLIPTYKEDWDIILKGLLNLTKEDTRNYLQVTLKQETTAKNRYYIEYAYYVQNIKNDFTVKSIIDKLNSLTDKNVIFTGKDNKAYILLQCIDKGVRVFIVEEAIESLIIYRLVDLDEIMSNEEYWRYLKHTFDYAILSKLKNVFYGRYDVSPADIRLRNISLYYDYKSQLQLVNYTECSAEISDFRLQTTVSCNDIFKKAPEEKITTINLNRTKLEEKSTLKNIYHYCVSTGNLKSECSFNAYHDLYYNSNGNSSLIYSSDFFKINNIKDKDIYAEFIEVVKGAKRIFKKDLFQLTLDEISLCSGEDVETFLSKCHHIELLLLDFITKDSRLLQWDFNLPCIWTKSLLGHYSIHRSDTASHCKVCDEFCNTYLSLDSCRSEKIFLHSKKCLEEYKKIKYHNHTNSTGKISDF